MRKAGILLICLLAIGIAGLIPVGYYLSAEKDNIQITETVLYGDKALAEGIQITFDSRLQWNHYWNSVYTIGTNPEIKTQYIYYPTGYVNNTEPKSYDGISFESFPNYGAGVRGLSLKSMVKPDELLPAYQKLADDTDSGESKSRVVRISDYFTYYPVWADIQTEYFYYNISSFYGYIGDTGDGRNVDESNQKQLYNALNEYFRIPVLKNDSYLISVTKDDDGVILDVSGRPESGEKVSADTFCWDLVSVSNEEAVYFTFVPYSEQGKPMSTDLIPGGFGIYRLPYEKDENGIYRVKENELETICALNPEKVKKELFMEIDKGGNLRIITGDEETVYFQIFDMKTRECRQEFAVERQSSARMDIEWETEDFMVCSFGMDSLVVIEVGQDNNYEVKCRIPMGEDSLIREVVYGYDGRVRFDWNGKQLVYVLHGQHGQLEEQVYLGYQDYADFHVGICDETGLVYLAEYLSSLHAKKERLPEYRYSTIQCQAIHSALAVEWGK